MSSPFEDKPPKKPWFGPKRFGYGLRPQTWQGWAITAALVVVVVLIATLAGRHGSGKTAILVLAAALVLVVRVLAGRGRR